MENHGCGVLAQDSDGENAAIVHDYVIYAEGWRSDSCHFFTIISNSGITDEGDGGIKWWQYAEELWVYSGTVQQSSILENLPLAKEHLVFYYISLNPVIKCAEIVASPVSMKKVTAAVITQLIIQLRET